MHREATDTKNEAPEEDVEEKIEQQNTVDEKSEETNPATEEEIVDELTEEEKLLNEVEELKSGLQRERAEFMNFKKRTIHEKADLEHMVAGRILHNLLPALDSFDMFFSNLDNEKNKGEVTEQMEKMVEGMQMIQKQVVNVFTDLGVEEMNPINEEFDPNTMEALQMQESPDVETNTVSMVYQKGYKINDKVVRASRVLVQKPIESKEEKEVGEEE